MPSAPEGRHMRMIGDLTLQNKAKSEKLPDAYIHQLLLSAIQAGYTCYFFVAILNPTFIHPP
jgi:hypothetical protein